MDKLKMHSPNLAQDNIARLREMFPGCVTEAGGKDGRVKLSVDFDQLRQELAESLVEGPQERYHLNWPGKREALLTANAPIAKTLRPCREESVDFDTTKHLFIEGENLDALKLLQETYLGKVKMIYIDPPYNTGNDFLYEDDFADDPHDYLIRSNQKNDTGARLSANTESNGRFHSDWLSMIYARLKLARSLLREDGLIFISIDDGEYHNLRKLCDELFGEQNFVDNIIWKKRYGGGAKEKFLVSLHEYTLVFAKNIEILENIYIPLTEESIKRYYTQKDAKFAKRGPFRTHPLEATKSMGERRNLVFPIDGPDGVPIYPQRQWLWSKERVSEALGNGELDFIKGKDGRFTVHTKQYLRDEDGTMRQGKPFSMIDDIYTQHGTNEIIEIFGNAQIFSFPKPSSFIQRLVDIGTTGKGAEVVLDFFAGSASTAQAVFQANAKDEGDRRLVLIQLAEQCDEQSEAFRAGYKSIAEVSKERIRRSGKRVLESVLTHRPNKDVGFRTLKVADSNMADVYYAPDALDKPNLGMFVDNIKPDRTPEDLLFQVMLDWGVDLALPIAKQTIQGKDVFLVNGNALAACFDGQGGVDEDFVKELAQVQPLRVVFRDAGFKDSAVKINVEQIFKLLSPATEVKCM
jgi:adenine-specific DNA-methyltransferase